MAWHGLNVCVVLVAQLHIEGRHQRVHAWPGVWSCDTPAAGDVVGRNKSYSKAVCICRACTAGQTNRLTPQGFLCTCDAARAYQLLTVGEDQRQRQELRDSLKNKGRRRAAGDNWLRRQEVEVKYGLKQVDNALTDMEVHGVSIANRCPMDVMHVLLEGESTSC